MTNNIVRFPADRNITMNSHFRELLNCQKAVVNAEAAYINWMEENKHRQRDEIRYIQEKFLKGQVERTAELLRDVRRAFTQEYKEGIFDL